MPPDDFEKDDIQSAGGDRSEMYFDDRYAGQRLGRAESLDIRYCFTSQAFELR
jgi:hypothetical protein